MESMVVKFWKSSGLYNHRGLNKWYWDPEFSPTTLFLNLSLLQLHFLYNIKLNYKFIWASLRNLKH